MPTAIISSGSISHGFSQRLSESFSQRGWVVEVVEHGQVLSRWRLSAIDVWLGIVDGEAGENGALLVELKKLFDDLESAGIFSVIVKLGDVALDGLPSGRVLAADLDGVEVAVNRLASAYEDYEAALQEVVRFRRERRKEVVSAAEEYIDTTLRKLGRRATLFISFGVAWHVIAAVALAVGIYFGYSRVNALPGGDLGQGAVFRLVGTFVGVVGLLLALAGYAVSLGRFFVHEGVVLLNRQHAIRYGRFFLLAYGDNISRREVAEVLQDWNIVSLSSRVSPEKGELGAIQTVMSGFASLAGSKTPP